MKKTALYEAHEKLGAKIVEFAGYAMPIQYEGIIAEHNQTRSSAGLFDVSHMGQAWLEGAGAEEFVNSITPSDFSLVEPYQAKYTVLTNKKGGIVDDLIITKITPEKFFFVYNAGCRAKDEAHIRERLENGKWRLEFTPLDKSLIALQGKKAEEILQNILPSVPQKYMTMEMHDDIFISRLGYTGEDGFEISVPNEKAPELWNKILANPAVKPIGLGARDSLRLEMGYPLYGHDINDDTTPIEASLGWIMPKEKRSSFPTPKTKRVGFEVTDKAIVREGAEVFNNKDEKIGKVTSGGYSPYLNKPIAQGYVNIENAGLGHDVKIELRGRKIPAKVAPLFFMKPRTKQ